MLKPQAVLEKWNPDDTNIYVLSIPDRYENCPGNLDDLCVATSSYTNKKAVNVTVESEDLEN